MIDEVAEGGGADIVAADQPQPGDPLSFRQRNPVPSRAAVSTYVLSLLPDLAFRAGQQALNIGPVLDPGDDAS